MLAGVAIKY